LAQISCGEMGGFLSSEEVDSVVPATSSLCQDGVAEEIVDRATGSTDPGANVADAGVVVGAAAAECDVGADGGNAAAQLTLACEHCGARFTSRNQLFRHLKEKCDPLAVKPTERKERIILVAGYLGSRYFGCLQGANEDAYPTVEGAIFRAVRRAWNQDVLSIIRSTRTEKRMHAVENVFVITLQRLAANMPPRCEAALRRELELAEVWLNGPPAPVVPASASLFDKVYDCRKRVYRCYVPIFALIRAGAEKILEGEGFTANELLLCERGGFSDGLWLGHLPNDITCVAQVVEFMTQQCSMDVEESDVLLPERGGHAFVRMSSEAAAAAAKALQDFTWLCGGIRTSLAGLPVPEAKVKIALQRKIRAAVKALRGPAKGHRDFHNFVLDAEPGSQAAMRNLQHCSGGVVGEELSVGQAASAVGTASGSATWIGVEWTTLTFSAKDFGPQQLRRMIGAIVAVVRGVEDLEFIDRCFEKLPLTLLPAPVEALCLESVQFGAWNSDWRGAAAVDSSAAEAGQRRIEERIMTEAEGPWRDFVTRLDLPGATRVELQKELAEAAAIGDCARVSAAIDAGAPLEAVDEYGQSALFLAACAGQAATIQLLARAKADVNRRANGGSTPCASAAARKHSDAFQVLVDAGADAEAFGSEGKTPKEFFAEVRTSSDLLASYPAPVRTVVIPEAADHAGAGTVYVDGCFDDATLDRFGALWEKLPLAPKDKASPTERAYFADTEGWMARELQRAVDAAKLLISTEVMLHMRFLIYPEPGGSLPAHVDLSRVESTSGRRSTHTFLLYLSDCSNGGETTFLECREGDAALAAHGGMAPGPRDVVGKVLPKRGRLLLMPHACPHLAAPTYDVPKVLIRGEVIPIANKR